MTDTSSIPRVLDALMLIPQLPANQALFADVEVCDGPWTEVQPPAKLVMIGMSFEGDAETNGQQVNVTFGPNGGGRIEEDYGVPCEVRYWVGDNNAAAQSQARAGAFSLLAPFETAIRTNGTLNNLIVPPPSGQPISVTIGQISLFQTSDDQAEGRIARILFTVHVQNSLNF
jgi:hypothetical protein